MEWTLCTAPNIFSFNSSYIITNTDDVTEPFRLIHVLSGRMWTRDTVEILEKLALNHKNRK